jgi:hypothetical protein
MTHYVLPKPTDVVNMLGMLLAAEIKAQEQKKRSAIAPPAAVAIYIAEDETIAALSLCDLAGANYLGAALSLLPPAVVSEGVKTKTVSDAVLENLREVLNVCVSLYTHPQSRRLRLRDLILTASTPLPAEVTTALRQPAARLDLEIDVSRYGRGHLTLVVV